VIGLGLRQLQDALNHKADGIQHEFVKISDRLQEIAKMLMEARGEERDTLRQEMEQLRSRQQAVADDVNIWRERARSVMQQRGKDALRALAQELLQVDDADLRPAAEHVLFLLDASEEQLAALAQPQEKAEARTPAARLIERARVEYDLRGADKAARQRAAVEFSNRPGMAQNLEAVADIEAAMEAEDPMVREVAILTAIQLHRFRATRMADLDAAHQSLQRLAQINHASTIPVLIEVLEHPRTGFVSGPEGAVEAYNDRSRMVALLRLVEWHTAEARAALRARQFDRDPAIVKAAERALELFPGDWTGPLKPTAPLNRNTA
jgi:hypothetical protein